jgi:hypothetical protein
MTEQLATAQAQPPLKKVAIVGGGPSRRRAPYSDPTWEIWAFSSKLYRYPRVNRWFELHALADLRQQLAGRKPGRRTYMSYKRFLRRLSCPVYMQKAHPDIPQSVAYPLAEVKKRFGRCFTSTASYMVALAIMEGYDVIGLWGIDVKRREYLRQRPALRYLLGVARQQGIRVVLARGSRLSVPRQPRRVYTRVLYAYGWRSPSAWWRWRVKRRRHRLARRMRVS